MIGSDFQMYIIVDKPTVFLKRKQRSKHDLFGFIISTKIIFISWRINTLYSKQAALP
jgi:ubiquinone biosynthesis protein Coq4